MENAEILDPVVEVLSRRRKNMFATALPALLVAPPLRQRFANLLSRNDLPFGVISHDEITPEVTVVPIEVLLEEGSGDDDDSEQFDDSDESGDATMEAAE